jgi:hypothetical protein
VVDRCEWVRARLGPRAGSDPLAAAAIAHATELSALARRRQAEGATLPRVTLERILDSPRGNGGEGAGSDPPGRALDGRPFAGADHPTGGHDPLVGLHPRGRRTGHLVDRPGAPGPAAGRGRTRAPGPATGARSPQPATPPGVDRKPPSSPSPGADPRRSAGAAPPLGRDPERRRDPDRGSRRREDRSRAGAPLPRPWPGTTSGRWEAAPGPWSPPRRFRSRARRPGFAWTPSPRDWAAPPPSPGWLPSSGAPSGGPWTGRGSGGRGSRRFPLIVSWKGCSVTGSSRTCWPNRNAAGPLRRPRPGRVHSTTSWWAPWPPRCSFRDGSWRTDDFGEGSWVPCGPWWRPWTGMGSRWKPRSVSWSGPWIRKGRQKRPPAAPPSGAAPTLCCETRTGAATSWTSSGADRAATERMRSNPARPSSLPPTPGFSKPRSRRRSSTRDTSCSPQGELLAPGPGFGDDALPSPRTLAQTWRRGVRSWNARWHALTEEGLLEATGVQEGAGTDGERRHPGPGPEGAARGRRGRGAPLHQAPVCVLRLRVPVRPDGDGLVRGVHLINAGLDRERRTPSPERWSRPSGTVPAPRDSW